jgi:hypothetical protein
MTPARINLCLVACLALATTIAAAQTPESSSPPDAAAPSPATAQAPAKPQSAAPAAQPHSYTGPMWPTSVRIFSLSATTTQQQQNEILVTLRNILDPRVKITLSPSQNTILLAATEDQIALAQKIIESLDKPSKSYRLTYTLIDLDGTKRVGDQHYKMVLVPGQRAILKQGNRVPVVTGAYLKEIAAPQSQMTYLDIGMDFEATLDDSPNSLRLKTKVSESSIVDDRSSVVVQDPVIRQSVFEGSAMLTPGKPVTIGTLDINGTTRRIEIQATVEPINP